jgi:hypothetical protein
MWFIMVVASWWVFLSFFVSVHKIAHSASGIMKIVLTTAKNLYTRDEKIQSLEAELAGCIKIDPYKMIQSCNVRPRIAS